MRFQLLRRFFDGFVFFFAESVGSRAEEGLGSGWGGVDSGAGGADGAEYNMAMIVLANQRPRGRVNPMNCACAPAACRAENARAARRATTTHQRLRRGSNPLFPALWSHRNTVSMDARQKKIPSRNALPAIVTFWFGETSGTLGGHFFSSGGDTRSVMLWTAGSSLLKSMATILARPSPSSPFSQVMIQPSTSVLSSRQ